MFKETDIQFTGEAKAEGTNVGTHKMNLKAAQFSNKNANFKEVEFKVLDGSLTITPKEEKVIVTIQGNKDTKEYDGKSHSVTGYTVTNISNVVLRQEKGLIK